MDLERIDSCFLLLRLTDRAALKERYGMDFFRANQVEAGSGKPFPEFFQVHRDGGYKGSCACTCPPSARRSVVRCEAGAMIENERQYAVTRKQLAMLADSLAKIQENPQSDVPEVIRQGDINGIRFLMADLEAEIAEYEKLRVGQIASLPLVSVLDDLPSALTRARIARGWTQRDLAKALGTTEQQVQKDERGGYAKASLARLRRVANVLGMSLTGEARLAERDSAVSPESQAVAGSR